MSVFVSLQARLKVWQLLDHRLVGNLVFRTLSLAPRKVGHATLRKFLEAVAQTITLTFHMSFSF